MNIGLAKKQQARGASLIEAVIAMGVLSVAIPLVFGALAESGKSGLSSEAETRSTWIVPNCMEEILASRDGRPQYFTATAASQAFPPSGEIWALAFSQEGKTIGKITTAEYETGIKKINDEDARYIAILSAEQTSATTGAIPMMRVLISLEYPSSAPAKKRQKLDFHTRIP